MKRSSPAYQTYIDPAPPGWYAERMRLAIWIACALLVITSQVSSLGCSGSEDSPVTCTEDSCECENRPTCDLDCGDITGCEPSCLNFGDSCTATCTDDCVYNCQGGDRVDGVCGGECGANCDTSCVAVASCIVDAGPNSTFLCANTRFCQAELGDGSNAQCIGVEETCAVRCLGECEVLCGLAGACAVDCVNGDRQVCTGGLIVCGPSCPGET